MNDQYWQAITTCDAQYDGIFYYGVTSTQIVCLPSCKSKSPNRNNVRIFFSIDEALGQGFRPCKRCQPNQPRLNVDEQIANQIAELIDSEYRETLTLSELSERLHISPYHLHRIFKRVAGTTPADYLKQRRIEAAKESNSTRKENMTMSLKNEVVYWSTFTHQDRLFHLAATDTGLCCLTLPDESFLTLKAWLGKHIPNARMVDGKEQLALYKEQLEEYFQGRRRKFTFSLDLRGTAFQKSVWHALMSIPYGETRSYSEIAETIHSPKAVRAVAAANGANPVPIIVPCHRVIGKNGTLTGYRGGLSLKAELLKLEQVL